MIRVVGALTFHDAGDDGVLAVDDAGNLYWANDGLRVVGWAGSPAALRSNIGPQVEPTTQEFESVESLVPNPAI